MMNDEKVILNARTDRRSFLTGMAALGISSLFLFNRCGGGVYAVAPEACTGCGNCVSACRYSALTLEQSHTVESQEAACTGCGDCVTECPQNAISLSGGTAHVTTALCNGCGLCVPVRNDKALTWRNSVARIDGSSCEGCGKCKPRCLYGAISG